MADDIVIRAEGLGKKYLIGHEAERERYVALRDVIARGVRNAWRMAADMARGRVVVPGDTVEELWALRDINFEVRRGEVLGIIGRNGAGKSTLLKVLSRITEPTEGRVTIKGRVASLLEVGTGFHPELTGRENIYLNGAVLGMSRAEIKRKFDEIVAFADVEKFLDTPVKRYSSGMYVRLAFAVAAHLEPEILIVDEVLAVGDAQFQKKCLGKMSEVSRGGRTILFVSHNLAAMQSLCGNCLLLSAGRLVLLGTTEEVVREYLSKPQINAISQNPTVHASRYEPVIKGFQLLDASGMPVNSFAIGSDVTFRVHVKPPRSLPCPVVGIGINNYLGTRVLGFSTAINHPMTFPALSHASFVDCRVPCLPLAPGMYYVKVTVSETGGDVDVWEDAFAFTVEATDWYGTGRVPTAVQSLFFCKANWTVTVEDVAHAPLCRIH